METFNLLAKSLQQKIWDMKWERFMPIQEQAIATILQTKHDVIICAPTASGKTEAAMLPILTHVEDSAKESLKIIYISPLKALINNQFERLEKLCQYMSIEIHRWHGDVSASQKHNFIKRATGILQITPESIESLFINYSRELVTLFGEVEYLIIDEIHSLIDTERGVHLRSLLSRIERLSSKKPRIIGLSATIANFELVNKWINFSCWETVNIIEDTMTDKILLYYLMFFDQVNEVQKLQMYEDVRALTKDQKGIIFCNSRACVEEATVALNRLAKGEFYYAHHSSVHKREREYVEQQMMKGTEPKSVIATSSLELGIDIGHVDLVIQIDSTFTVSSLKQRLGRSGRKPGAEQVLQLYATSEDSLLQGVAVMELMLANWIEPATGYPVPYDVLVQQCISICAEKNGITETNLIASIEQNHSFYSLERTKVQQLVGHLVKLHVLEKINDELIVGIVGERILGRKDFYALFKTESEFEVINGGKKVGVIDRTPWLYEGDHIMLSGKFWNIISIDYSLNRCYVEPALNGSSPKFLGRSGKIHQRVGEKMSEILCYQQDFNYLDSRALHVLNRLRQRYRLNQVSANERIVWKDGKHYVFETFTSTKITTTLFWFLKYMGASVYKCDALGRIFFRYERDVAQLLQRLNHYKGSVAPILKLKKEQDDFNSKYATYLPEALRDEMHVQHEFDLEGVREFLNKYRVKVI